jgi:hypothetical protein
VNKSDLVGQTVEQRLAEAKRIAEEKNIGAKSGLDPTGKLREGDRDPVTGRLILDPLKIPTSDQGAPGSVSFLFARTHGRMPFKPTRATCPYLSHDIVHSRRFRTLPGVPHASLHF